MKTRKNKNLEKGICGLAVVCGICNPLNKNCDNRCQENLKADDEPVRESFVYDYLNRDMFYGVISGTFTSSSNNENIKFII